MKLCPLKRILKTGLPETASDCEAAVCDAESCAWWTAIKEVPLDHGKCSIVAGTEISVQLEFLNSVLSKRLADISDDIAKLTISSAGATNRLTGAVKSATDSSKDF